MGVIDEPLVNSRAKRITYDVNDNGCWECNSHSRDASGYYKVTRRHSHETLMHRYIYELHKGLIRGDKVIKHICNNKRCINPDHLEAGSQKENIIEAHRDGLKKCKLTDDQIRAIRRSRKKKSQLAIEYDVSDSLIRDIKTRRAYAWV